MQLWSAFCAYDHQNSSMGRDPSNDNAMGRNPSMEMGTSSGPNNNIGQGSPMDDSFGMNEMWEDMNLVKRQLCGQDRDMIMQMIRRLQAMGATADMVI